MITLETLLSKLAKLVNQIKTKYFLVRKALFENFISHYYKKILQKDITKR